MNTLLKTITCSIAITSIAGAAEQNAGLDNPHNNPQIINHLLDEDTSMAIAASLAEQEQLDLQNNSQHDDEMQLAIQMSLSALNTSRSDETDLALQMSMTTLEDKNTDETDLAIQLSLATLEDKHTDETDLALQMSMTTLEDKNTDETDLALQMSMNALNEKNIGDDARYQITDRAIKQQIATDSTFAYDFDAKSDSYGQDSDPELQRILHESAQEAYHAEKEAKEQEDAIALSMKKEPAQDATVLIKVAEAIAANTTCQKITNLTSYCSHFSNFHKLELDREAAIKSGTKEQSINDMIARSKREMDKKAAALKNILLDQVQLNALIDILKDKFPDYSREEILDILKEIGK